MMEDVSSPARGGLEDTEEEESAASLSVSLVLSVSKDLPQKAQIRGKAVGRWAVIVVRHGDAGTFFHRVPDGFRGPDSHRPAGHLRPVAFEQTVLGWRRVAGAGGKRDGGGLRRG